MAQEGWALQNAGFCTYTFEKTEPGQYIIRLAMLDSSPDFESFMGELEAQSVGHCFSWGYFRRSAQLGPFDMFSDVESRISHLNRIGQVHSSQMKKYVYVLSTPLRCHFMMCGFQT